ncbi:class I SAM-dependent methyltransferase [Candidatus Uhrbacteria bacterium]|nr:class I SAM-dependent methyltransferase [Candidatus Uhrbacteria bacterium]
MNRIEHTTLYDSSEKYFAGPNGMNNEVAMWYVAGGVLTQELAKRQYPPFGGLRSTRGFDARKNIEQTIDLLDVCSGPMEFPNHLSMLFPSLKATCVDINDQFMSEGKKRFSRWKMIMADVVLMHLEKKFSVITASSAYHHIPDTKKEQFLKNLSRHLVGGGFILVCDNFIPRYGRGSRKKAVDTYYRELKKYFKKGHATSEAQEIISGVHTQDREQGGEYKVSFEMFKKQCARSGFEITTDIPVWQPRPLQKDNAGSHVIVLKKKRT